MNRYIKSIKNFYIYFLTRHPLVLFIIFIAPISVVLKANIVPYALKLLIDAISNLQIDTVSVFEKIKNPLLLGGGSWISLILVERFQCWLQSKQIPKFESDITSIVFNYVLKKPYHFFSGTQNGNITSAITDLTRASSRLLKIVIINVMPAFFVILAAITILSKVSAIFSLIISLWIVLQLAISYFLVQKINSSSIENAGDKSSISGIIVDVFSNITSVKLNATETFESTNFKLLQKKEEVSHTKVISAVNIFCLSMDISVTVVLFLSCYLLVRQWQVGMVSVGDFILVFYTIFSVMNQLWQTSYALSDLFREFGVAKQSLHCINHLHEEEKKGFKSLKITEGRIQFKNVRFGYKGHQPLFANFNLDIEPKQKVGIVGYSGSGKSSLVNLLTRLYPLDEGQILIDGQDISQIHGDSLKEAIAVSHQDNSLFFRTIKENMIYGHIANFNKKQIDQVAKQSNCEEFIARLPEGYGTVAGEKGSKLSIGQRQRICIARTLLKDAPIVVLDEVTSSLDSITDRSIQLHLNDYLKEKTAIIITHKLLTIVQLDRILVLDKGKIVEDGSHEDLLKAGGLYSKLWLTQSSHLDSHVSIF